MISLMGYSLSLSKTHCYILRTVLQQFSHSLGWTLRCMLAVPHRSSCTLNAKHLCSHCHLNPGCIQWHQTGVFSRIWCIYSSQVSILHNSLLAHANPVSYIYALPYSWIETPSFWIHSHRSHIHLLFYWTLSIFLENLDFLVRMIHS